MKAVRYDHFGGIDVLYLADVPKPEPKAGEVLVQVKAAGINPGEASIREGYLQMRFPSTFPSGQGTDFAGIVAETGEGVSNFKTGDEVVGYSHQRSSQAEYVLVPASQLVKRPADITWEEAGGLFVAGTTAYAAVEAVAIKSGDTLIVSGAAGGVGSIVVQLAKNLGVNVIGLAGEHNHQWLRDHGITPVAYEGDTRENIEKALNGKKADAFIDTYGKGYVALAIDMGIPADRINTIIDFEAVEKFKVKAAGSAAAANAEVLGKLVTMIANGELDVPVAKTYPLAQVQDAFRELEQRHTRGKIVLIP